MRVIFREAAYADLDRIYSWITRDNPGAAARVVERILDSTELLRRHPHIGHAGSAHGTYEWVVRGTPYIVVYAVAADDDLLTVLAVFHGAQDR